MWAHRKKEREETSLRSKEQLKEAILNVLNERGGRIVNSKELHKALPIKRAEASAFRDAYNELVSEGKIKQYIGLP